MDNQAEKQFRALNEWETSLMHKLLSPVFPGVEELREQVKNVKVVWITSKGSPAILFARGSGAPAADVSVRIPVEAEGADVDGVPIHLLLHVTDSFIKEVEVFREDGNAIQRLPDVETLTVLVNSA